MVPHAVFSDAACELEFDLIGGDVPPTNGTTVLLSAIPCMPSSVTIDNSTWHGFYKGQTPGDVVITAPSPLANARQRYLVSIPATCVPACKA